MEIKLSVVILSITSNVEMFKMTIECIESLQNSDPQVSKEIIVMESNKNYLSQEFQYPSNVRVIIPEVNFNFHKFLNIGIKTATGEFVALCNNDLIFHENWFNEILRVKRENPAIRSFSPNEMVGDCLNSDRFEIGYRVQHHIKGWCIVAEKNIFPRISYLDEQFDFYYADNDYSMSLILHNIKHAVVYNSHVEHLEKKSSANILAKNAGEEYLSKYKTPNYLFSGKYQHIIGNEKGLDGFLKFYSKWGDPKWVFRKNRIAEILFKFNLGYLAKFMYYPKKGMSIFKDC